MHVEYAQLPPPEDSADRVFVTDNAVIVLDGATAFVPVPVSAQTYADHLGRRLVDLLTANPEADLREALAEAIRQTAGALDLRPGESPSSTVSILRVRRDAFDVLVIGDSPVIWGTEDKCHTLVDNRLAELPLPQREQYKARLRAGHGYDNRHRELLRELQTGQAHYRNTAGGYWIAETDPNAAHQALVTTIPRYQAAWAILATDGAFDLLIHLGANDWSELAKRSSAQLTEQLEALFEWEEKTDPCGHSCPRAKFHDDKAVAAFRGR